MAQKKFGIFTSDRVPVGYKADTFWNLSSTWAKPHSLELGGIPAHIIQNLEDVLYRSVQGSRAWVDALITVSRERFPATKGLFVGYAPYHSDDPGDVILTHEITKSGLQAVQNSELPQWPYGQPVSSCCQAEIREDNRCAACKDGTGALEDYVG